MIWLDVASVAVTLFLVMDPLGNVPLFHALLTRVEPERRIGIVVRELLIALGVLFTFLLAGNIILAFLDLSGPSLSISGGVLLFLISVKMIFTNSSELLDHNTSEDPFIVPLAVPLIAGPSSIAILLLLSSQQPERITEWSLALLLAWLATAAILLLSPKLLNAIGKRGSRALERLMGMILVIIATQMLLNGIRDFIQSL